MNTSPLTQNGILHDRCRQAKLFISETEAQTTENILQLVYTKSLYFEEALMANDVILESIRSRCGFCTKENTVIDSVNRTFRGTGEIFEETVVGIISDYSSQIKEISGFNQRLIDSVQQWGDDPDYAEKLIELILKNFKSSMRLIIHNAETIIRSCTRYINLNLTFNEKLAETLPRQIDVLRSSGKDREVPDVGGLATEWWKQNGKEEAA